MTNTSISSTTNLQRDGIAIAGNLLVDAVKIIDRYPEKGTLATIRSITTAVGGCVPNTIINLAALDPSLQLQAIGRLGKDAYGDFILNELQRFGVHTDGVILSPSSPTSFSDIMSEEETGDRTIFHTKGANVDFGPEDMDLEALNCRILHIGYLLLLDRFDASDEECGTVMAHFLRDAQAKGIRTSIDVTSVNRPDYAEIITPALRYCNYVLMNEIECCRVTGLSPRFDDGSLNIENIEKTMRYFLTCGVKEKIIIHAPEAGFCLSSNGKLTIVPSLQLPKGYIQGAVGAGDAFASGVLYSIYHGLDDKSLLEFASCAAAANLSASDAISGMRSAQEVIQLQNKYERDPRYACKSE